MKKLSIAIPTLNRCEYLTFTLTHFISQLETGSQQIADKIEIVVVNNNSDDDTSEVIHQFSIKYPFIKFFDCKERVPLGEQFKRTVKFSEGEYVIIWGDDDIPAPFLVEYLLNLIEKKKGNLYFFNRLVGYEENCSIKSLTVLDNKYTGEIKEYNDSNSFLADNFLNATFITSLMFNRKVWEKGQEFDTSRHYGYEFMGILYYGNKGDKIISINYPLCIQRKVAFRAWGPNWPIYGLLGTPNLVEDLEKENLFANGIEIWRKKYNKFPLFCYTLMAAAEDRKRYKPYCRQFAKHQNGWKRKALVYCIIYLTPKWGYKLSRKILFKIKK